MTTRADTAGVADVADVAIVGAGPAGSWAAYCLARQGARVIIFDPSHPREKPCGGGITGRALALVGGAIDRASLPASTITHARFLSGPRGDPSTLRPFDPSTLRQAQGRPERSRGTTSSGSSRAQSRDEAIVSLGDEALAVTSRRDFDAALLAAACGVGATLVRARVTDVALEGHRVRLETSIGAWHTPFVIGADGANSLVRRRLARPFRRDELSIATGFFARGVTSREIVIELVGDPPGYIWSFPRPGHLAIGICAQADAGSTVRSLRDRTARWIRDTRIAVNAPLDAYSWPIPSLTPPGFASVALAGAQWCLVGDAAGLVDPITREGIYFALLSGQWAADSLASDHTASSYVARARADILPELAQAARLKAGFFRPAFTGLLLHALQHSAAVRAVMADLVAGQQPYAGLRRRLLSTFELGLAWKAFVKMRRGTLG